jgi:hypothetical protein
MAAAKFRLVRIVPGSGQKLPGWPVGLARLPSIQPQRLVSNKSAVLNATLSMTVVLG